jgi:hypothetical protein
MPLCRLAARTVQTTSCDVYRRSIRVAAESGRPAAQCHLLLVDSPGSATFTQRDAFARHWANANFVALVFDVGSRDSFASAAKWLRRAQEARAAEGMSTGRGLGGVVIGAKCDFRDAEVGRAEVAEADARAFAEANGMAYFEVSAERAAGVEKPFAHLAALFMSIYSKHIATTEDTI